MPLKPKKPNQTYENLGLRKAYLNLRKYQFLSVRKLYTSIGQNFCDICDASLIPALKSLTLKVILCPWDTKISQWDLNQALENSP